MKKTILSFATLSTFLFTASVQAKPVANLKENKVYKFNPKEISCVLTKNNDWDREEKPYNLTIKREGKIMLGGFKMHGSMSSKKVCAEVREKVNRAISAGALLEIEYNRFVGLSLFNNLFIRVSRESINQAVKKLNKELLAKNNKKIGDLVRSSMKDSLGKNRYHE